MKKRSAVMITHTHWDREWYLSLEQYRFRLVRCMDTLLDTIKNEPGYHSYWLDGQTIPIDDYLAVRPEKRDELTDAMEKGKILIGPWYVSADEFMIAGEACIRNLFLGFETMRKAGQDNRIGYLADIFGHVSQLPQILQGFGIDNAVFWRGYREEEIDSAEQIWKGADGTEVLAVCLVRGYSSASHLYGVGKDPVPDGHSPDRMLRTVETLRKFTRHGPVLLMNGVDHALPTPDLPGHIRLLEKACPDLQIRHTSLQEYLSELRGKKLPRQLDAEMRYVPGLESTGSARIIHKLANTRVEDLLIHYAEPLQALCAARGDAPAPGFLRRAWIFLIKNHSHDSISGSHSDNVADDVMFRFRRAEEIGRGVVEQCLQRLSGQVAPEARMADASSLWLFNPCGWDRTGPQEVEFDIPSESRIEELRLVRNGSLCPMQLVSVRRADRLRFYEHVNPTQDPVLKVRALVDPGVLPSTALEPLDVRIAKEGDAASSAPLYAEDQRVKGKGTLKRAVTFDPARRLSPAPGILDNGLLRAAIHPDGSVDMTHVPSGMEVRGLNLLVDEPEAGDLYQNRPALPAMKRLPRAGDVAALDNGPLRAACSVRTAIDVGGVAMPVDFEISLVAGEDFVRVRATIDNTAPNHILRSTFPGPDGSERLWVHTPYDVVERRAPAADMKVFSNRQGDVVQFERGGALQPMQNGVALVGKTGTLFFLGKGLYEYAKSAGCPLGVTLLRGAGEIASGHFTMYETGGGQCLGRVKIEYAFGLADSLTRASFLKRVMEFRLPPRVWQTFGETPPATGMSVCSVSNLDWIVTGIKTPEQGRGIVVRVVNLSDRAQTGTLQFALPAARAVLSRLDETRVKELPLKGGAVRLSLGARQIATVVFEQA